jgi:hypothetical protein
MISSMLPRETPPLLLPERPVVAESILARLRADYDRFREALPADLGAYCLETYGADIAGEYAGSPIRNPFGKASGQLSLNARQVRRDAEAGLGFVVLKTVIAQDASGAQKMAEWAVRETHMRVDRITGADGTPGWTVTWKGRGWHESFESYCRFFGEAAEIGGEAGMPVAASVKYHLPAPGEGEFSAREYRYTTQALQDVWRGRRGGPMPLEKDFSPTLAGDDRSREQEQILTWLRRVPELIHGAAGEPGVCLGVKLMNARFDLAFQEEMLRVLLDETPRPPEFVVYANRLFDPEREFEGKKGAAYGGPDLSRRNLAALRRIASASAAGRIRRPIPPVSGTGDILTGKMAVEYGLLGASSCQMHTIFQLPDGEFGALTRNKTAAVLHHLVFHPDSGLLAWLLHLGSEQGLPVSWRELPRIGRAIMERAGGGGSLWRSA